MAKVAYGAGVSQMVNKLGNVVYFRNRSGDVARTWLKPADPSSPKQKSVRASYKLAHTDWSNLLSDQQRLDWQLLSNRHPQPHKLATPRPLSGWQLYLKLNLFNYLASGTPLSTNPPQNLDCDQPLALTFPALSLAAATWHATLNTLPNTPVPAIYNYLFFYLAPPTTAGRISKPLKIRFSTYMLLSDSYSHNHWPDQLYNWGLPTIGQRLHMYVKCYNSQNGMTSPTIHFSAVITS